MIRRRVGDIDQAQGREVLEQVDQNLAGLKDIKPTVALVAQGSVLRIREVQAPGVESDRELAAKQLHLTKQFIDADPGPHRAIPQGVGSDQAALGAGGQLPALAGLALDQVDAPQFIRRALELPALEQVGDDGLDGLRQGLPAPRSQGQLAVFLPGKPPACDSKGQTNGRMGPPDQRSSFQSSVDASQSSLVVSWKRVWWSCMVGSDGMSRGTWAPDLGAHGTHQ